MTENADHIVPVTEDPDVGAPEPRRCPVCTNPVEPSKEAVRTCFLCEAVHHAECWRFNCGCGVYGCREEAVRAGLCVMCGERMRNAVPLATPEVELVFFDKTRPPGGTNYLCPECTEKKLIADSGIYRFLLALSLLGLLTIAGLYLYAQELWRNGLLLPLCLVLLAAIPLILKRLCEEAEECGRRLPSHLSSVSPQLPAGNRIRPPEAVRAHEPEEPPPVSNGDSQQLRRE